MLPFTIDQFFGVFAAYNVAIWPAQVVAYGVAARHDRRRACETIALAHERIDEIDFDARVSPQIAMVPGERISPNAIVWSSNTMKVPFGDTLGVPLSRQLLESEALLFDYSLHVRR